MTLSQQVAALESQCVQQRETIGRLTARIRFLENLTGNPATDCWLKLGLNYQQRTVAILLVGQDVVSRERIMAALYSNGTDVDPHIVETIVSGLRKKLPAGVKIANQKKLGWYIPDEGRRVLRNVLADRSPVNGATV